MRGHGRPIAPFRYFIPQAGAGNPASAPSQFFVDGGAGALGLGIALFGSVSIWGMRPQPPPASSWVSAAPQAEQRRHQPQFSRGIFPVMPVMPPVAPFFVAPQTDLSQPQPWFGRQTIGTAPPLKATWQASPQLDQTQIAPWFSSQVPFTVAPAPRATWQAYPQYSLFQPQPWFSQAAVPPVSGGAGDYPTRKKKYTVRRGDELLVFSSKQQALDVLLADASPKLKKKQPKPEPVPEVKIELPKVKAYAETTGQAEKYQVAFDARKYEALIVIFEQMRDEEEIELLLMHL